MLYIASSSCAEGRLWELILGMLEAISSGFGEPNVVRSLFVVLCVEPQPDSCHLLSFPSARGAQAGVVVLRRVPETRLRSRDRWQAGCAPPGDPYGGRPGLAARRSSAGTSIGCLSGCRGCRRLDPRGAPRVPLASGWPHPADEPGHRGCSSWAQRVSQVLRRRCCRSSPTAVQAHPRTGRRCVPPQPPDAA